MKVTRATFTEAEKLYAGDVDKIAAALGISTSSAYRLKKDSSASPGASITALVDKKSADADIKETIFASVYSANFIPAVNEGYSLRAVDTEAAGWLAQGDAIYLLGDAGSGKTTMAEQIAARAGLPFLRVCLDNSASVRDNIGRVQARGGTMFFKAGILLTLLQQPSVILFDEVNAADASRLFFLHELLDARRFFIRDAGAGLIIDVHKNCQIIMASNPNNARYGGTNKLNAALVNRCAVVNVPRLDVESCASSFDCGDSKLTESLKKYYEESNKAIKNQSLRVVFSLRNIKRIAAALRRGVCVADALAGGFYNSALLTAGDAEREAMQNLASVIFGIDTLAKGEK